MYCSIYVHFHTKINCHILKSKFHAEWTENTFGLTFFESGADPGFGQGGAPAYEAENCRCSEAESPEQSEQSVARVQGPLKGPGSFWVFNAQICILTHSRDSFSLMFDIYFDTKC